MKMIITLLIIFTSIQSNAKDLDLQTKAHAEAIAESIFNSVKPSGDEEVSVGHRWLQKLQNNCKEILEACNVVSSVEWLDKSNVCSKSTSLKELKAAIIEYMERESSGPIFSTDFMSKINRNDGRCRPKPGSQNSEDSSSESNTQDE